MGMNCQPLFIGPFTVVDQEWSVLQEMEVIPKLGLSGKEGKDTYQIDVTWRGDAQYFATSVCSSVDRYGIVSIVLVHRHSIGCTCVTLVAVPVFVVGHGFSINLNILMIDQGAYWPKDHVNQ